MSYAFPIERPLPFGAWDTCMGPFIFGSTQVAQFTTRWVAWVGTNGIRFGKWNPGMLFNDTDGQPDDLFPGGTRPSHLSFSFEQDALHALAIQTAVDTCVVRRKVSGTPTAYTFTGRTPILFYNGIAEPDTSLTDLTVFYIKAAGTKIYARRQRDNFGIEYEINPTLNATLRALQKTDALWLSDGTMHQLLWALDTNGRQVYYQSGPYPPFTPYAEDRLTLSPGFDAGAYGMTIEEAFAPGDGSMMDAAFTDGVYYPTIISSFATGEVVTCDVGFDTGIYFEAVIPTTSPGDAASVDTGFDAGVYALQIVETTVTEVDSVGVDCGFDSGVYTA